MNINDLTIGQAKELVAIFSADFSAESNGVENPNIYSSYVGKYVICRSRNEGVNAGIVVACDETGVSLSAARRLYYHKPASKSVSWYEGVAECGVSEDSRVGVSRDKLIIEDYSLTLCTDKSRSSIVEAVAYAQS